MAKTARPQDLHRLWVFGQSYDFYPVTPGVQLVQAGFTNTRHQKTQIVLHNTSGNGSAERTIDDWNTGNAQNPGQPTGTSANFVVERILTPQATRPANTGDQPDTHLVDAVRVIDEDLIAHHAGNPIKWSTPDRNIGLNRTSLGIEIACLGEELHYLTAALEAGGLDTGLTANDKRPKDANRWLHMPRPYEGRTDVMALDDEQYMTLTLLLRHLCIRHHIPRQFFGNSYSEIFKHWFFPEPIVDLAKSVKDLQNQISSAAFANMTAQQQQQLQQDLNRKQQRLAVLQQKQRVNVGIVQNFRGILVHRNVHREKICPGVVDRNRLYRGISDEWWLPVQPDGTLRPYYSGPFKKPVFTVGQQSADTKKYYFRYISAGKLEGTVFRDANLDALLDTKSYYRMNEVDSYYGMVETRLGGVFPMGTNKVWHGGVHFGVKDSNPCVFAAAGGTIMAARLTSNKSTEQHLSFGSQRFILLKHAVFREMQTDPRGLGKHINYDTTPKLVFTLYMHLNPFEDLTAENDKNPPWFNLWRRANPAVNLGTEGETGKVFAPNMQVLLGDILGTAGFFRGRRMIHFEILSHQNTELTGASWDDDANQRAVDTSQDLICDVAALENYLSAHFHKRLDQIDPLEAAKLLRKSKAMHKSEWALSSQDQIATLIPHPQRRNVLWPHIQRFSWVSEAIAVNPRLSTELGDANGMFWHYHPIAFMQDLNHLALTENRTPENPDDSVNPHPHVATVQLSADYYLTNFVRYSGGQYILTNVDTTKILVSEISQAGGYKSFSGTHVDVEYAFSRADIACMQPGTHSPESTPPQFTRFSLTLLDILQQIYEYLDATFPIALSHICTAHNQAALCVMNDGAAASNHAAGIAVDIQPATATAAECKKLWNAVAFIVDPFNVKDAQYCGMASQADLPDGFTGIRYLTTPGALAALRANPQQEVPASEVAGFKMHLELITQAAAAAAAAGNVNLRVTLIQLLVINAASFAGHCGVNGFVNGNKVANTFVTDGTVDQVIPLDWPVSVSLGQNDQLKFSVTLVAEDPTNNDTVSLTYSSTSNPAWGINAPWTSSNAGAFILGFKVEWDQSDF